MKDCKVVGIDLAGSPKRNTGICTLKKNDLTLCSIVHTDQEIFNYIEKTNPALIAIDAPLNLPPGRKSTHSSPRSEARGMLRVDTERRFLPRFKNRCLALSNVSIEDKNGEHFRPCDRELLKRGIHFFPITLGPMRLLTERGTQLKKILTALGYTVVEVYPGAAQDIWKIDRKQDGISRLSKGLQRLGVKGLHKKMSGDELDAVTAALVGQWFLRGKAEVLGNFRRGAIIIPYAKETA